jgi:hypothetical protein
MEFSRQDWGAAPKYASPWSKGGLIALDFDELRGIAEHETQIGSFRPSPDGTLAKAPLIVEYLPAAFYKIETEYPKATPTHNTGLQETLVVVDGILKLALTDTGFERTFFEGEVVDLRERSVAMQALNVIERKGACLTLALYSSEEVDVVPILS